jgi:hypothetical protein
MVLVMPLAIITFVWISTESLYCTGGHVRWRVEFLTLFIIAIPVSHPARAHSFTDSEWKKPGVVMAFSVGYILINQNELVLVLNLFSSMMGEDMFAVNPS